MLSIKISVMIFLYISQIDAYLSLMVEDMKSTTSLNRVDLMLQERANLATLSKDVLLIAFLTSLQLCVAGWVLILSRRPKNLQVFLIA